MQADLRHFSQSHAIKQTCLESPGSFHPSLQALAKARTTLHPSPVLSWLVCLYKSASAHEVFLHGKGGREAGEVGLTMWKDGCLIEKLFSTHLEPCWISRCSHASSTMEPLHVLQTNEGSWATVWAPESMAGPCIHPPISTSEAANHVYFIHHRAGSDLCRSAHFILTCGLEAFWPCTRSCGFACTRPSTSRSQLVSTYHLSSLRDSCAWES